MGEGQLWRTGKEEGECNFSSPRDFPTTTAPTIYLFIYCEMRTPPLLSSPSLSFPLLSLLFIPLLLFRVFPVSAFPLPSVALLFLLSSLLLLRLRQGLTLLGPKHAETLLRGKAHGPPWIPSGGRGSRRGGPGPPTDSRPAAVGYLRSTVGLLRAVQRRQGGDRADY